MKCVRCQKNKRMKYEKICRECLIDLRKKFNIPKEKDPLEDWEVKLLIQEYENSF